MGACARPQPDAPTHKSRTHTQVSRALGRDARNVVVFAFWRVIAVGVLPLVCEVCALGRVE